VGKKKERKKSHASKLPRNLKKQKELKMEMSENINEIAEALAMAQAEIQNPAKDSANTFFKSKYADLAEVLNVTRPAFSKHGLNVTQWPFRSDDGAIGVTTMISHKSGQWMRDKIELPLQVAKNICQDAGGQITYLRRYALAAAAGIAQEDADANLGTSKETNTGTVVNLKTITKDQAAEIVMLIAETESDHAGLLQYAGADSIETIPAANYQKVIAALNAKLEKANAS
jgi:hypothetical protein